MLTIRNCEFHIHNIYMMAVVRSQDYVKYNSQGGGGARGFVLYLLNSLLALLIKYFKVFYPISVLFL